MSRLASGYEGIPVRVETDATTGAPHRIEFDRERTFVQEVVGFFREWIGVLEGEPQRDVWHVKDASGRLCELHHLFLPWARQTKRNPAPLLRTRIRGCSFGGTIDGAAPSSFLHSPAHAFGVLIR